MKYLVISKPRGNLPPTMAANILTATKAWINARIKDRSVEYFYAFTIGGGVGVANADSHEALILVANSYPGPGDDINLTNLDWRVVARGISASQFPMRSKLIAVAVSTCFR